MHLRCVLTTLNSLILKLLFHCFLLSLVYMSLWLWKNLYAECVLCLLACFFFFFFFFVEDIRRNHDVDEIQGLSFMQIISPGSKQPICGSRHQTYCIAQTKRAECSRRVGTGCWRKERTESWREHREKKGQERWHFFHQR